jgi:hypothetical protein
MEYLGRIIVVGIYLRIMKLKRQNLSEGNKMKINGEEIKVIGGFSRVSISVLKKSSLFKEIKTIEDFDMKPGLVLKYKVVSKRGHNNDRTKQYIFNNSLELEDFIKRQKPIIKEINEAYYLRFFKKEMDQENKDKG